MQMSPLPGSSQNLGDLLRRSARRHADKPAIRCGDVEWTYAEFDRLCSRLAAGLSGAGVGPGEAVAVLARNSHAFAALRFALARLGAVLVPINFMLKADEAAYILRHAGAPHACVDSELAALGRSAAALDTRVRAVRLAAERGDRRSRPPACLSFDELAGALPPSRPISHVHGRRPGADRLHQRHRIAAQGRDADATRP